MVLVCKRVRCVQTKVARKKLSRFVSIPRAPSPRPVRLALSRPSLAFPSLIRHCNAPKLFECEINVSNKFRCNLLAFASNAHGPEHANLTSIENELYESKPFSRFVGRIDAHVTGVTSGGKIECICRLFAQP